MLPLCSCSSMINSSVSDEATTLFNSYKAKDENFKAQDIYFLIKAAMIGSDKETKAGFKELKGMWMVEWEQCPQAVQKAFLADVDKIVKNKKKRVDTSDKGVYTFYYTPVEGVWKREKIYGFSSSATHL